MLIHEFIVAVNYDLLELLTFIFCLLKGQILLLTTPEFNRPVGRYLALETEQQAGEEFAGCSEIACCGWEPKGQGFHLDSLKHSGSPTAFPGRPFSAVPLGLPLSLPLCLVHWTSAECGLKGKQHPGGSGGAPGLDSLLLYQSQVCANGACQKACPLKPPASRGLGRRSRHTTELPSSPAARLNPALSRMIYTLVETSKCYN